jgi:pimeloyl-ACP methyl ester carboxylesterase
MSPDPAIFRSPRADGVVLLHGIARTSRSLRKMERSLQASSFATFNIDYPSRKKPLEELAAYIHPAISAFAASIDGPLHFVGHSMGGLLTRVYIARHRPERLGRVVMLGTPNAGSEIADFLQRFRIYRAFYGPAGLQLTTGGDPSLKNLPPIDYPVGIIAGIRTIDPISSFFLLPRPNDGKVSVHSTRLEGSTGHTLVAASHTAITHHPLAIEKTRNFLLTGRFNF